MTLRRILALAAAAVLLASCGTSKHYTYLQDLEAGKSYPAKPAPELMVQPGDRLDIEVVSSDPALSAPFNPNAVYNKLDMASDGSAAVATASNAETGYLVDVDGTINFPVLGRMNVEGMTLKQIQEDIASKIEARGYINDPLVHATLGNFTVTLLGEMGQQVMEVNTSYLNVLQAIAKSGQLEDTASLTDVTVIRTSNGERKSYELNLRSKDIFDSPAFYLQQNDILYVKPLATKTTPGFTVFNTLFGTITSTITSAFSIFWMIDRVNND